MAESHEDRIVPSRRRLLLLRHAKSDWSTGTADKQRPLAERGRKAAPLVGAYLASARLFPDLVLVSSAKRTRETWTHVGRVLASNAPVELRDDLYEAEAETILSVIRAVDVEKRCLLVVGHNPGLEDLALLLVDGTDSGPALRLRAKFPTAGLAIFTFEARSWSELGPGMARLDHFITPKSLAGS